MRNGNTIIVIDTSSISSFLNHCKKNHCYISKRSFKTSNSEIGKNLDYKQLELQCMTYNAKKKKYKVINGKNRYYSNIK